MKTQRLTHQSFTVDVTSTADIDIGTTTPSIMDSALVKPSSTGKTTKKSVKHYNQMRLYSRPWSTSESIPMGRSKLPTITLKLYWNCYGK